MKSSKRKQHLYEKYLKKKTSNNKGKYDSYKKLFESIKKKAKKQYYSRLILKYKDNMKKTWQVIQELTGKA